MTLRKHRKSSIGRMHEHKRPFTMADAYEYAARGNETHAPFRFNAYPCLWCDFWHVGRAKTGTLRADRTGTRVD